MSVANSRNVSSTVSLESAAFLQKIIAKKIMEKTAVIRMEPTSILDLGSCHGMLAKLLAESHPDAKISSIDNHIGESDHSSSNNIRDMVANIQKLPYSDWSHSAIYSNLLLQHIPDKKHLLAEIKRVLAPGGYFLFSSFGPKTLMELRSSWAVIDDYKHVNDFSPMQHVADSVAQQGFVDVVVSNENIVVKYDSLRQIFADLVNADILNTTTLEKYQDAFTPEKLRRFCQEYYSMRSDDGSFPVTYEIIYGICWAPHKANESEHLVSVNHLRNIMQRFKESVEVS